MENRPTSARNLAPRWCKIAAGGGGGKGSTPASWPSWISWFPRAVALAVHLENVAAVRQRSTGHLLLAFDEDGLDVAALDADGDGNLVEADAGIAGRSSD